MNPMTTLTSTSTRLALSVLLLGQFGCGTESAPDSSQVVDQFDSADRGGGEAEFEPIQTPDLSRAESEVRDFLELERSTVDRLLESGARSPEVAAALGQMGRIYQAHDYLAIAASCYRNALLIDAEEFDWHYYLGVVHQAQGRLDGAASEFLAALRSRSDDVASLYRLGRVTLDLNRPTEAGAYFSRALAADSNCVAAEFGLGEVARTSGELGAAVEHFREVLRLQPQALQVHYTLGQVLLQQGEEHAAAIELEQSSPGGVTEALFCPDPLSAELAQLTTGAPIHLIRGRQAALAGNSELEIAEYRRAVDAAPGEALTRRSLGFALGRIGDLEAALSEYREAAKLEPGNPEVRHDIGLLLMRLGSFEAALVAFEAALSLRPDYLEARTQAGMTLLRLGQFDRSLKEFDQILEGDPAQSRVQLSRAMSLAALGRRQEALGSLIEFLDRGAPQDAMTRFEFASAVGALGDSRRAFEHFSAVIELNPPAALRAQTHLRVAVLFERDGEVEKAVANLRQALEINPNLEAARQKLAALDG